MRWVLPIAAIVLLPAAARGGAWTLAPGQVYAQAYFNSFLSTQTFFDSDGNARRSAVGEYRAQTFGFYSEIGVTPGLTALFEVPFSRLSIANPEERYLQPRFRLGARGRLLQVPLVVSVQGVVNIPVAYESDPAPHRFGDGRFEGYASLLLSRSLGPVYLTIEIGGAATAERPEAQLRYGLEVGYSHRRFYAQVGFAGAQSLRSVERDEDPLLDVVGRFSYLFFTPKVGFHLGRYLDFEARATHSLAGRNVPVFTEIGGALAFKWKS